MTSLTSRFNRLRVTVALSVLTLSLSAPGWAEILLPDENETETEVTQAPEPAPEPVPTPEQLPAPLPVVAEVPAEKPLEPEKETSSSVRTIRDYFTPLYQQQRPNWAVEIAGAAKALGPDTLFPGQTSQKLRGVALQFEFQPAFVQTFGILGFGPSLSLYPALGGGLTRNAIGIWSGGGQVRYQARFFKNQFLVPMVGYSAEQVTYSLASGTKGSFTAKGAFFGGMLLLNLLDPMTAAEMYVNQGVYRTYVLAEFRNLQGGDSDVALTGRSAFFGLRFEY